MHFHLPKPLHGWREFVGEVGIIVIGVLIALGAEQILEDWRWHEKLAAAQKSIDYELNAQLDYSQEVVRFSRCAPKYVDVLEAAILRHDAAAIGKLHDTQPPFRPRPWRTTAWQSAMSTQVADHMDADKLAQYALIFTSFEYARTLQASVLSDFAQATTGRLGGPSDPASTNVQLAAAERLRTELSLQAVVARSSLESARGPVEYGWKSIPRRTISGGRIMQQIEPEGALCDRTINSLVSRSAGKAL